MSAPTLLQIVPTLAGGGLARATLDAAQAVIAAGGSAIVASPGGAMVPDLLRLRATHLELPDSRNRLWARLTLPRQARGQPARGARRRRAGALARRPRWIARALARRLGIKWIATLHRPFIASDIAGRFIERRQARADAVIAVSEHVARDTLERFPTLADRLETIPPGINFDRFDPAIVRADRLIRLAGELRVPDGSHLILCPARFGEDNGQKILIDAVKRLDRDDVFCLLLGSTGASTPFEKELERGDRGRRACTAGCRSAPMSTTCRPPTCWPTSWWRPAAAARASAARWWRRRRWAGRWWPRMAAARRKPCAPGSPDGWRRRAMRRHSPRRCRARCRCRSSAAPNSRARHRSMCAATMASPSPTASCSSSTNGCPRR